MVAPSPPVPRKKHTIAIIGAGIAGPVFALTILSHPILSSLYTPIIYEKLPAPSSSAEPDSVLAYAAGAAVALTANALFPLFELGLREEVERVSCECERIQIWRSWGRKGDHALWNQITNPGWKRDLRSNLRVVERRDLRAVVLDRYAALGGLVEWGRKVVEIREKEDGARNLVFEDGSQASCDFLVGADGAWSRVRKHIVLSAFVTPNERQKAEERWKPEFSFSDGVYGISKKFVANGREEEKPGDTHAILLDHGTASTWALPDGKQFWTISIAAAEPPSGLSGTEGGERTRIYGADVSTGGYDMESTRKILEDHENVYHPVAGSLGEMFRNSERIVRSPLWHRAWEAGDIGGGNAVVIGDAGRVMVPSSGQGACFGIEDATVLATAILNNPPTDDGDFASAVGEYVKERAPRSKRIANQSYWTGQISLGNWFWWRWARDLASKWIPMGGDPREKELDIKDPMGWIHDVRLKVELRAEAETPSS